MRGHQIGKVQAASFYLHYDLFLRGLRVWNLLQFENLGTAETSDDEGFHAESLTGLVRCGRAGTPSSPPPSGSWSLATRSIMKSGKRFVRTTRDALAANLEIIDAAH